MCGTQARQHRNPPSVFTSITLRHSAASILSKGRSSIGAKYAALLTRMSTRPNVFMVSAAMRAPGGRVGEQTPPRPRALSGPPPPAGGGGGWGAAGKKKTPPPPPPPPPPARRVAS